MKATRDWGPCACQCGSNITPGSEMVMFEGAMYLAGHEQQRRTRSMAALPKSDGARKAAAKKK
jgi:hypothetical protein